MDAARQTVFAAAFRPPPVAVDGVEPPETEPRAFARGAALLEAGAPIVHVHLVTRGLVATLARTPGGASAETGLFGPGALIGHAAALGAPTATSDAVALTEVHALTLEASALLRLSSERPRLHRELMAYAVARFADLERLCVCAAVHSIEQRLARWLLSAAALSGDKPIEITHQRISDLFGVRRASVTTCLHMLEGEQAVRCRRGRIEIRDLARLEAVSCGCRSEAPPRRGPRRRQDAFST